MRYGRDSDSGQAPGVPATSEQAECYYCGRIVEGRDEQELGDDMADHIAYDHG